jgi:hypothetical protein
VCSAIDVNSSILNSLSVSSVVMNKPFK